MARPPVHHLVGEIYGRNRIVAKPIVSNFVEASTIADDVAPPLLPRGSAVLPAVVVEGTCS